MADSPRDPVVGPGVRGFLGRTALCGVYLWLAISYVERVPLFEAPDEPSHFHYVGFVASEGRAPRYLDDPEVPGQGMQPPLYYFLAAPLFARLAPDQPDLLLEFERASRTMYGYEHDAMIRNRLLLPDLVPLPDPRFFVTDPALLPLRFVRGVSVSLGLGALLFTIGGVRRLGCGEPLALTSGAVLALNPQFVFVSSSVSNETAAVLVSAVAFWLVAPILGGRPVARRDYLAMAALAALGLLTKNSTLPGLAVAAAAIALSDGRAAGRRLADAALAASLGLALMAPHLLWNLSARGDPLGMTAVWRSAATLQGPEDLSSILEHLTKRYPVAAFESFWARFGWMNISAPAWIIRLCGALSLTGVAGLALAWWRPRPDTPRIAGLAYGLAAFGVTLAAHLWFNTGVYQAQGRHLFAAGPQLGFLLALGLHRLVPRGGGRDGAREILLAVTVTGALAALAHHCLTAVIVPSYS